MYSLLPLSSKETMIYLHSRMQAAGSERADTIFPFDVCDRLREQSGGWPGTLNRYALEAIKRSDGFPVSMVDTYAPGEARDDTVDKIPVLGKDKAVSRLPPKLIVTRDGGQSFEALLRGERVYDFAFDGARVYIAGENGLFISEDDGRTWRTVRNFFDPTQPDRTFRPGARVFSVALTNDALWVGTEDGLFKSPDGGLTWRVFRAEVPLSPEGLPPVVPPSRVPRVEAYAYPNPFSPSTDRFVRIRYKLDGDQSVQIRIFDFAMNLVRNLAEEQQSGGEREISWDGTDNQGARVANGAYFYAVEADGETFWGKVLVLE